MEFFSRCVRVSGFVGTTRQSLAHRIHNGMSLKGVWGTIQGVKKTNNNCIYTISSAIYPAVSYSKARI